MYDANRSTPTLPPTPTRAARRRAAVAGAALAALLSLAGAAVAPEPKAAQESDAPAAATQPATQQLAATQPDAPRPAARPAAAKRAGTAAIARDLPEGGALDLMANKSIVLKTRVPYKNVSISQPEIADVSLVGP